jgi:Fe-S-cluster containining protein
MDSKEIRRIFYRDGYRLAHAFLDQDLSAEHLKAAINRLYQSVDELLDSFLERTASDGAPTACKKGCAWCCYQGVFAVSHEFLYLQDHARQHLTEQQRQQVLERARDKSRHTLNKPVEELLQVRMACPFLEKGSCMVYAARPMACRIYLSSSVPSCKKDHDRPTNGKNIPELFEFPLLAGRMLNEGFVAYLKQSGIRSAELPLEQGYSSMVTMGQTMDDWMKGGAST